MDPRLCPPDRYHPAESNLYIGHAVVDEDQRGSEVNAEYRAQVGHETLLTPVLRMEKMNIELILPCFAAE